MTNRTALITGVTGQDGAYLAEILLEKNYRVHGVKRRTSMISTTRIDHLYSEPQDKSSRFMLHYGDVTDAANMIDIIRQVEPNEIYNLAAQSHVQVSFQTPHYSTQVNALGALNILEAIRVLGAERHIRFYQASSSEMFGSSPPPQNEDTPFQPRSPYAAAKLCAYWMTVDYREAYGMFAVNGILFNHEGPTRGETFVTRKITRAVARISLGLQDRLYLGNLDARRDWGYARDYAEGIWQMLQQDEPRDYVLATGEAHSVREFVEVAFEEVGISLTWEGAGEKECGLDPGTGKQVVEVDPRYFRPAEVDFLIGDSSRAAADFGWRHRTNFKDMVRLMVNADVDLARREQAWLSAV